MRSLFTMAQTLESDQTLRQVSIMSITAYTGRMMPIRRTGTSREAMSESVRKKQPIGTPAFPTAARVAIRIHTSMVGTERSIPAFCIR